MDIEAVAKEMREKIFDRAEQDGRVMHASSVEEEIGNVLRRVTQPTAFSRAAFLTAEATEDLIRSIKVLSSGEMIKEHLASNMSTTHVPWPASESPSFRRTPGQWWTVYGDGKNG